MVVYTVLSGAYDRIKPVPKFDNIDFFLVTDENIAPPKGWKLIFVKSDLKGVMFNRRYKMLPFDIFSGYADSIYIDANISIVSNPIAIFNTCRSNGAQIGLYDHPIRQSVYDEADEIKKIGYAYFFKVNRMMDRYKDENFSGEQLYEANIIYRRHDSFPLRSAMTLWWNEFCCGVKRDQLSLTYSCGKYNIDIFSLGKHDARFTKSVFSYNMHIVKNSSSNIKAKIINRIANILSIDKKCFTQGDKK